MTFSDVGETSPGYGHVIDHMRAISALSVAMAVQTEEVIPYLLC